MSQLTGPPEGEGTGDGSWERPPAGGWGAPPFGTPPPGGPPFGAPPSGGLPSGGWPTAPPPAGPGGSWPLAGMPPMPAPPYGGGPVPPGTYLDPASGLVLPMGTVLAPVGRRIGAYFLGVVLAIVTLGVGYLIWGAIVWGRGTSPALSVLGMRVWEPARGRPAGWWRMALRDVVGGIIQGLFFPIVALVSFIFFLATREHRTLCDMVAGTVVIHDPNKVVASR